MNWLRFVASILGFVPGFSSNTALAVDPDSLQSAITIAAVAYDDGFGLTLKEPSGIWFDPVAEEVLVADPGNGRVVIYDRLLAFKYSFRHFVRDPATGRTIAGQPKGMAVNSRGEILLQDAITDRLDLLDFRGKVIDFVWPRNLLGDTTLRVKTSCLTTDAKDRFYVVVNGDLTTILFLDQDLRLVRQIGEKGDLDHQLNTPVGIGFCDGKIYIGDLYGSPAVKVFDTLGQFLFGFAGHDVDRADLTFPVGFGFLSDGSGGRLVLVADGLRQTVKVYNQTGEFITMIGGYGRLPGFLQYPSGLASDGATSFYVLERAGRRVQKYVTK